MNEQDLANAFGRMGVGTVQIGSTTLWAVQPGEIEEVVGAGDTFRKGDVVLKEGDSYPQRVLAIFPPRAPGLGPGIWLRMIDEGAWACRSRSPINCTIWNDNQGWRNIYRKLDQSDLDAWFKKAKKLMADGWHSIPVTARFRIEAGVPVEIERRLDLSHKKEYLAEEVGRRTGYDLTLSPRYSDRMKRRWAVTQAVRRLPPLI